jgi:AcrR family transcriptional regulator
VNSHSLKRSVQERAGAVRAEQWAAPGGGGPEQAGGSAIRKMRPKDRTKELIARTALGLFVAQGFDGTTIRDIATAAQIAEGTLYRHYAGKEALAWELFSDNFTAFALELQRRQAGEGTLRAKLDAMVRQFCAFFDRDPVLFSYLLLAQHGQLQKVTPDMPNPVEVVREVLAGGMDRGEIPAGDPDLAAALVMGMVLQVAVFTIYRRLTRDLTSLADVLVAACWRVLAGQAAGPEGALAAGGGGVNRRDAKASAP